MVKNRPANTGDTRDTGSIPGLARSPGVGNGNSLQYSFLEIPWTEKPGGLQSVVTKSQDTTEHTRACTHTHTEIKSTLRLITRQI